MFYIIATIICGVSFAPFLFFNLDMWHAQGIWTQIGVGVVLTYSFLVNPKRTGGVNKQLGLVHLWVFAITAFMCYMAQINGKYDVQHFFPYFNFLCLLIFYQTVNRYLDTEQIKRILKYMRVVLIFTLFMCVLQILGLSQFFKLINPESQGNNIVVGFIGNPTHLSGFLATFSPLFLIEKNLQNILYLVLLCIVLGFTGTTVGDPSISGIIIMIFILFYLNRRDKKSVIVISAIIFFIGILLWQFLPKNFFGFNGRIGLWKEYWKLFHQMPITGQGLGTVNLIYQMTQHPNARHLHLEYFQFAFELGIIGFVLIGNLIIDFIRNKPEGRTQECLKACVYGFLISGLFNFPAHLWLVTTWVMFIYASFFTLKDIENKGI